MNAKKKLNYLSLIAFYPILSTLLMTLIWQIEQVYITPFLGGYYFKWVYLYSEYNGNWLYLPYTRVLYTVYILGYLTVFVLTWLIVLRRKGKALGLWCLSGLWLADCGWILAEMIMTQNTQWQSFVLLAEHILFIAIAMFCSLYYLKIKKKHPELFVRKHPRKKAYKKRFE